MLINSPNISGSLTVTGNATITGSLTVLGGINATITGSATSASYVEYANVANKPTLVSESAQIIEYGIFATTSSNQFSGSQVITGSLTVTEGITGTVSTASYVEYSGIANKPTLVSESAQIEEYGIFATTGSNQFNGSQAITGSLTVTGQVIAQTLNVQQVTSSIVFSSGSNIFGNSLDNTQQFTGSVSVTGSLNVNGIATSGTVSGTTNFVPKFTGASTIGNSLVFDNGTNVGIGTITPTAGRLQINVSDTTTAAHFQIVDGTTTLANSFVTNFRNANDGNGRYSLSSWQAQNAVGNDQNGFIGIQSITGGSNYTPNLIFGQKTGISSYGIRMTLDSSGNLGLGVTPSAWASGTEQAFQVGNASIYKYLTYESGYSVNCYFNAGWKYISTDIATQYKQSAGQHIWYTAPSGTAGNAITFTQAMTLNASGNLSIGNTNDIFKLDVSGNTYSSALFTGPSGLNVSGYGFLSQTLSGQMTILGHNVTASNSVNNQTNVVNGGWISSMIKQYYNDGITFHTSETMYSAGAVYPITNTERMRITSGGNVGIGTITPGSLLDVTNIVNTAYDASNTLISGQTMRIANTSTTSGVSANLLFIATGAGGGNGLGSISGVNTGVGSLALTFGTRDSGGSVTEKMRITSGGFVGIGSIDPQSNLEVRADNSTAYNATIDNGQDGLGSTITVRNGNTTTESFAQINMQVSGDSGRAVGRIVTIRKGSATSDMAFVTENSNVASQKMLIKAAGNIYLGNGYGVTSHRINLGVNQGDTVLVVSGYEAAPPGSGNDTAIFYGVNGASGNAAATALWLARNSSTGRSINAGGTINASGADYAEYMTKAIEDNIAKGDIVGVDSNGLLTNIFDDAISFVVKSTDPSYVGGDVWGNIVGKRPSRTTDQTEEEFAPILEEFEAELEIARAKVDRIAFSGQVPCNVMGANVGDYIIPIETEDGKISGQPISNPTFEQYQISVGKVWKIMEDGRAWIAVKIG